jgi:hypothetical protein
VLSGGQDRTVRVWDAGMRKAASVVRGEGRFGQLHGDLSDMREVMLG